MKEIENPFRKKKKWVRYKDRKFEFGFINNFVMYGSYIVAIYLFVTFIDTWNFLLLIPMLLILSFGGMLGEEKDRGEAMLESFKKNDWRDKIREEEKEEEKNKK